MTEEVKVTSISPDETTEQQERHGFVPAARYGTIQPERNELGGIFVGKPVFSVEHGMLVISGLRCVERIFIVEPKGE